MEEKEIQYHGSVFKRLFSYLRPYVREMIVSLLLVLAITGFELLRPILIGNAIDVYIEGYNTPYGVVEKSDLTLKETIFPKI